MPTALKPLPRLPAVKGGGRPSGGRPPSPSHVSGEQYVKQIADPYFREVLTRLGNKPRDRNVARRVTKLHQLHPNGTLPELVAMDWLEQQGIQYIYLAQILGGHSRRGGVEVDLLFRYRGQGIAWLVNGNYWHSRPEVSASDALDKLKFLGATYHGIRITKVVALWEKRIYQQRPQIFEWGVLGIELGP